MIGAFGTVTKGLLKGLGSSRTSGDHPNYSGDHPNYSGDHPNYSGDHPNYEWRPSKLQQY